MRKFWVLAGLVAVLAGCQQRDQGPVFDGELFRAKLSKIDGDRANFQVEVRDAGKSVSGALEAGRFEATKHCIRFYGSSAVEWTAGPDRDPETVELVDGDLILQGTCEG